MNQPTGKSVFETLSFKIIAFYLTWITCGGLTVLVALMYAGGTSDENRLNLCRAIIVGVGLVGMFGPYFIANHHRRSKRADAEARKSEKADSALKD